MSKDEEVSGPSSEKTEASKKAPKPTKPAEEAVKKPPAENVWIVSVGTTGAQLLASYLQYSKDASPLYNINRFNLLVLDTIGEARLKEQLREGSLPSEIVYPLSRLGAGRNVKVGREIFRSQEDGIKARLNLHEAMLGTEYLLLTSLAGGTGAGGSALLAKWILEANKDNRVVVIGVWPEANPPNNYVNATWALAQLVKLRNEMRTPYGTPRLLIILLSNEKLLKQTIGKEEAFAGGALSYVPDHLVTEAALKTFAILNRYIVEVTNLFLGSIYPNSELVGEVLPCQQEFSNYLTNLGDSILVPSKIVSSVSLFEDPEKAPDLLKKSFEFLAMKTQTPEDLIKERRKLLSHLGLVIAGNIANLPEVFRFLDNSISSGYLTNPFVSVPVAVRTVGDKFKDMVQLLILGSVGDYDEIRKGVRRAVDILVTLGKDVVPVPEERARELLESGITLREIQEAADILEQELNIAEIRCGKRIPGIGIPFEDWNKFVMNRILEVAVYSVADKLKRRSVFKFRPIPRMVLEDFVTETIDKEVGLADDAPKRIKSDFSSVDGRKDVGSLTVLALSSLWYGGLAAVTPEARLAIDEYRRVVAKSPVIRHGDIEPELFEGIPGETKRDIAKLLIDLAFVAKPEVKAMVE
ncbi:MAG: hypothetical protein ACE5OY_04180 [Candidatus Bathyarchaeia archaeon]